MMDELRLSGVKMKGESSVWLPSWQSIISVPGEVAAGGVVLPTLRTLVLGLEHVEQTGGVLAPTVAGEEGLVGVGRRLPVVQPKDAVRAGGRLRGGAGSGRPPAGRGGGGGGSWLRGLRLRLLLDDGARAGGDEGVGRGWVGQRLRGEEERRNVRENSQTAVETFLAKFQVNIFQF